MSPVKYLFDRIDMWTAEDLLSPAQAETLKSRERTWQEKQQERRVSADEIFVYLLPTKLY